MKELDKIWSKSVKKKYPCCIACGRTTSLNAHHIFSRSYMNTRWDVDNGVTLCFRCHLYGAHQKYEEFRDKIIELIGSEAFDKLKLKSKEIKKWDKEELQELLESF